MKKLITFVWILTASSVLFSQSEEDCKYFEEELSKAIESQKFSDIDFYYYKKVNACGASFGDAGTIAGITEILGFGISWDFPNYQITYVPDPTIDWLEHSVTVPFDVLGSEYPLKKKFSSLENLLEAAGLSIYEIVNIPLFLPYYKIIWIRDPGKHILLDEQTLKPILESDILIYGGAGMFATGQEDNFQIYLAERTNSNSKIKRVLKGNGTPNIIPITNTENFIWVNNHKKKHQGYSLYDQNGKLLIGKQDGITYSPMSGSFILLKNDLFSLLNRRLKTIIKNAQSITEVWNGNEPYYLVTDTKGKSHLYDKNAAIKLSGNEYQEIFIDRGPYAIVQKDNQYAVIDFATGKELIPYQKEKMLQILPGFLTSYKNGEWIITDEKNRKTGSIKTPYIDLLNSKGIALIRGVNEEMKVGVYTVFGKEIIPQKYTRITLNETDGTLLLEQGEQKIITDLEGNEIK